MKTAKRFGGEKIGFGHWIDLDELVESLRKEGLDAHYEKLRSWSYGFFASVTIGDREVGFVLGLGLGNLLVWWDNRVLSNARNKLKRGR